MNHIDELFTSILQSKLNKFIEQHNIFNPDQFGFRPNSRTTDSLFILQQLLNKYTKQHKKLYVGFIDYEKAFDSVWQSGLIYKLCQYGVKGKFFKVIKSMYSSIKSCVKTDENSITELFSCNKGIRQGDGLSPVLCSLFMNYLPQYFRDDHCPGVMFGSRSLNCLQYADDLLVLSPSPEGLQKSLLKTLLKRTQGNGNSRSTPKNQISSSLAETVKPKTSENIQYGSQTLPIVDKQTYLGIEMTSGRYTYARDFLNKKAYKVLTTVKRVFSNSDTTTITIKNKLFDALVKRNLYYYMDAKYGDPSSYHIRPVLTKALLNKSISSSVNKH